MINIYDSLALSSISQPKVSDIVLSMGIKENYATCIEKMVSVAFAGEYVTFTTSNTGIRSGMLVESENKTMELTTDGSVFEIRLQNDEKFISESINHASYTQFKDGCRLFTEKL